MKPPSDRSPWLLRSLAALVGVLLALILLAAAEVGLRFFLPVGQFDRTQAATRDYQAWSAGPCYRIVGDRLLRVPPPGEAQAGAAETSTGLPLVKPAGVRRIVVVGESTGEMLERSLAAFIEQSGCGQRLEVLKCSASGSLPGVAVRRADEALAYSPDAIVVAIGHNFLLPGPPSQFELELRRSRLAHEVAKQIPPEGPPRAPNEPPPLDDSRDPPAMGREAYRRILSRARPGGVQVVALLLASNLWFRPKSEGDYVTSPQRATAWVQWARGDLGAAIATLTPTDGTDNALRAFERAGFHAQAGEWSAARSDLELARDIEPASVRASTATTAAIAAAAREGGAAIVDVDALFSPLAEHGIPGWDVFFDNCHPYPGPLDLLARTVLRTAAPEIASACLAQAAAAPIRGDADRATYRRLIEGPFRVFLPDNPEPLDWATYPDNGAWRRLLDGPFTSLLRLAPDQGQAIYERYAREALTRYAPPVRATVLDAMGTVARDAGRLDLAQWSLQTATTMAPGAPALVDLALIHLRDHDEAAARRDLQQARSLEGTSPWVRNVLAAMSLPAAAPVAR